MSRPILDRQVVIDTRRPHGALAMPLLAAGPTAYALAIAAVALCAASGV
jgi:hypothetical protein